MINLLQETKDVIAEAGKTLEDILWIGIPSEGKYCTWDEFEKIADFKYNDHYGDPVIHLGLVIVFTDNSWLKRSENDGLEWWTYNKCPEHSITRSILTSVRIDQDETSGDTE